MKFNISVNGSVLDSYENINIYAKAIVGAQIESKICDEQATELICEGLLEAYEYQKYPTILECLSKKARKDCKIVLSVINARRLAEKTYYSELSNQEGNDLIFGTLNKSLIFDQYDFIELLSRYGIQVVQIRIEGQRDIFLCKKQ